MNEKSTIRPGRAALTALCLIACFALAPSAGAVNRGSYSMEILIDGIPLEEHAARGTTYIEAREAREYSIRLRNHTGQRVAVALSVDGLNTIDAKTTKARDGRKWILGPWQKITLDGWQTTHSDARRFYFTTEEDSYGAWLGKTRNLGLITAAFFREKRTWPTPVQSESRSDAGRNAPSAPSEQKMKRQEALGESEEGAGLSDEYAATGIGRKVDHRVRQVHFDAEASPSAVMEVRYEYRDALVRLGVLPRHYTHRDDPLCRRERARGFEEMEFAPDPFK